MGDDSKISGAIFRFFGKMDLLPLINLLTNRQIELALDKAGFILVAKERFGKEKKEFTYIVRKQ